MNPSEPLYDEIDEPAYDYEPLEIPPDAAALGVGTADPKEGLPAPERIATLLAEVQGLKPVFTGILDFCREERRAAEVDERFAELTAYNFCTFSPVRVRALLEEAGALRYVEPETPEEQPEPQAEPDDGTYTITKRPEGWWLTTEDGRAALDAADPLADLDRLFANEPDLEPEYLKVLEALLSEPRSVADLTQLVEGDAPMRERRLFAPYLLKKLEERGAIEYRGAWTILDAGEQALAARATAQ